MDTLLETTGLSPDFWGNLGGLVLIIFVFMAIAIGKAEAATNPSPPPARNWDMFKLGEVYDEPTPVTTVVNTPPTPVTTVVNTPKPKKAPSRKRNPKKPISRGIPKHPLFDDAIDTLVSIGHKKSEAKRFVEKCLSENNPKSIGEFLNIFYSEAS